VDVLEHVELILDAAGIDLQDTPQPCFVVEQQQYYSLQHSTSSLARLVYSSSPHCNVTAGLAAVAKARPESR
jgi:hypothetical protein